ncbi:4-hydroxybenzoate transporter [Burkholderia sp. K24]|jgi:AAHS family 4-hydroxybenzoate transporter-like MFS transporter|nr:4-hydroxybenzoate transporter [Burkholderia sp. K24]
MQKQYFISELIDREPLTSIQWRVFLFCFLVLTCDGFDTQALAFTGPTVIQTFDLGARGLAPILTAGIIGMVIGSMILGFLGDKIGRRPIVLFAITIFGCASLATAFVGTPAQMLVFRFVAGLGMGGATPVILAITAEYCSASRRGMVMTAVSMGLPAGAIVGGLIASKMLPLIGWRGIFVVGGILPAILLVLLVFALPESIYYLAREKSTRSREKINRIINHISKEKIPTDAAYVLPERDLKTSVSSLFRDGLGRNTVAIWLVYLCDWVAWFMILSWLPTVLKASGLTASQAPMGTVVINAVAIVGCVLISIMLPKVNARGLLIGLFVIGIGASAGLAKSGSEWTLIFVLIGLAGIGIGCQQIILNYLVAETYPTALRATAAGWAIASGRSGAILGSASGGWFLEHGGPSGFYMALVPPMLVGCIAISIMVTRPASRSSFQSTW